MVFDWIRSREVLSAIALRLGRYSVLRTSTSILYSRHGIVAAMSPL